ncbi:MAG: 4Fe-4S dicluster domain-containing protein [Planctomycetota bacterium]|jgi:formate dehydrogenase iron-sulfur subunit
MRCACLVDVTRCVGCRSCQVACKQSKDLAGDRTRFFAAPGGYQNPARFTATTFTYVSYHEAADASGDPAWAFVKRQCMHCKHVYCGYVCPTDVFRKTESGIVAYRADACIGCAACVDACPFGVPAIDYWNVSMPQIRKCTFCFSRQDSKADRSELDGKELSPAASKRYERSFRTPACAKACPTEAICFGGRDELVAEARRRIAEEPEKYVDHVYGETEAGGTGWLYLSAVPFDQLDFPATFENLDLYEKTEDLGMRAPTPARPRSAWGALAVLAAGFGWLAKRRDAISTPDVRQ